MSERTGENWMEIIMLWSAENAVNNPPQNIVEWARGISGDDQKRLHNALTALAQNEEGKVAHFLKRIADATKAKDVSMKNLRLINDALTKIKQRTNKQEGITFPT